MYPRIPCELVANPKGSTQHTLRTAGLDHLPVPIPVPGVSKHNTRYLRTWDSTNNDSRTQLIMILGLN